MKITYRTLASYKGQEWRTSTIKFKSLERAMKAVIKLKNMFGNATLLTMQGNSLIKSEDF